MLFFAKLHPKAVHHHIGGLEKPETKHAEYYPVHHHIGGLENVAEAHSLFEDVHHHIGGLEISGNPITASK